MKEQGQEFDPSKEPVTRNTIREISQECRRIFTEKAEVIGEDPERLVLPFRESPRAGNSADGKYISLEIEFIVGANSKSISIDGSDWEEPALNRIDIEVEEELKDTNNPDALPERFSYMYAIANRRSNDFREGGTFLLLFISPPSGSTWWNMAEKLSFLGKQRANELLSQGIPIDKLETRGSSKLPDSPFYTFIKPNEENAKGLLRSLKTIDKVSVFAQKAF